MFGKFQVDCLLCWSPQKTGDLHWVLLYLVQTSWWPLTFRHNRKEWSMVSSSLREFVISFKPHCALLTFQWTRKVIYLGKSRKMALLINRYVTRVSARIYWNKPGFWTFGLWVAHFTHLKGGKHSSVLTNDGLAVNVAEPRLISAGGSFIRRVNSARNSETKLAEMQLCVHWDGYLSPQSDQ